MTHVARMRTELRCLVRELGLMNRNCLGSGMTLGQAHILTYIDKNGKTPFFELQTQLGMDKASLSRTLNALREKGWVRVGNMSMDRRVRVAEIAPQGISALREAEVAANETLDMVLSGFKEEQWQQASDALRLLRVAALRNSISTSPQRVQVEPLRARYHDQSLALLKNVFSVEQNIPEHLVPVPEDCSPQWWGIRIGEEILGVTIAWQQNDQWHWGRFAVDVNFRGLGLGKKLARESIAAVFEQLAETLVINAKDVTVGIVSKMGGVQIGPATDFYGEPVTPMVLQKMDFKQGN